jgi:hypothetical protein
MYIRTSVKKTKVLLKLDPVSPQEHAKKQESDLLEVERLMEQQEIEDRMKEVNIFKG